MTSAWPTHKLLAALGLLVLGVTIWLDPVGRYRVHRSEEAVRRDPFAGVSLASTPTDGVISARIVDQAALQNALAAARKADPDMVGTVSFAVLVNADGTISDLRFLDGTLRGARPSLLMATLDGARIYVPAAGAMTVRTVLGQIDVTTSIIIAS